jgi:hypothetical protein
MRCRPIFEEQRFIMTEAVPTRPFDDMEALAWLRSQPDGRVTACAAELGRRWGWNRMRTGRRLKAWQEAGLILDASCAASETDSVTPGARARSATMLPSISAGEARAFYERFDFIASPSDPMHLFVLLKDVRALISP